MIFQGDLKDIDPNSSTAKLINNSNPEAVLPEQGGGRTVVGFAAQEDHMNEHYELTTQPIQDEHQFPLEKSSSRLTDMLNGVSPAKNESHSNFLPKCLSAVPSPLHKTAPPFVPMQSSTASPGSFRRCGQLQKSKSIEDHFFMTNEHLDVVGKTTWDLLEMLKQEHMTALNTRHEELVEHVEKGFEAIKAQITELHEKSDGVAGKQGDMHSDLNKILSFIKQDIASTLSAHTTKATELETHVKELQKTVQALQQQFEQTFSHSSVSVSAHRSQPPSAGYYSNTLEPGRENQPPMPHMHENRTMIATHDVHHDHRAGHNNGYGQQWTSRHGYAGRSGKDDRAAYPAMNAYNFGAQFNNGYGAGYSAYGFPPDPSDPHHSQN